MDVVSPGQPAGSRSSEKGDTYLDISIYCTYNKNNNCQHRNVIMTNLERKLLQKNCRTRTLDAMLDLIWSQWTTLGVSGNAPITGKWIIDPEALVILTCRIGRYDPRAFDAMLEWLGIHQRFLNVQRLKTLNSQEGLSGGNLLTAIANLLMKPSSRSKWSRVADQILEGEVRQKPLFYLKDGRPHPHPTQSDPAFEKAGFSRQKYQSRNAVMQFRPDYPANLILKLRALFGVNARCEIIAYLATHAEGNPSEMAAAIGYSQKAVYNVMTELYRSGTVARRVKGRETLYSLREKEWFPLLWLEQHDLQWLYWREVVSFLIAVWTILDDPRFQHAGDSLVLQELTLLLTREVPRLPRLLSAPLEEVLHVPDQAQISLPAVCDAIVKFLRTLME